MKIKQAPLEVKKTAVDINRVNVAFEIKAVDDENEEFFTFEGLASTFNLDLGNDIIEPGAFLESINRKSPIILWQHDSREPIGMPMEIRETSEGLFVKVRLPKADTLVKGRVIPQIRVGSVRTMSIGFRSLDDERDGENPRVRRLKKVDLVEISLVTFPMNPEAVITGFKNAEGIEQDPLTAEEIEIIISRREGKSVTTVTVDDVNEIKTRRDYEKVLRESGFSRDAACMMAKNFQGEPDEDEMAATAIRDLSKKFTDNGCSNAITSMLNKLEKHNG